MCRLSHFHIEVGGVFGQCKAELLTHRQRLPGTFRKGSKPWLRPTRAWGSNQLPHSAPAPTPPFLLFPDRTSLCLPSKLLPPPSPLPSSLSLSIHTTGSVSFLRASTNVISSERPCPPRSPKCLPELHTGSGFWFPLPMSGRSHSAGKQQGPKLCAPGSFGCASWAESGQGTSPDIEESRCGVTLGMSPVLCGPQLPR